MGLIYGPSGCGKSSLVRAGLLPRLVSHVVPICVEATPADTEARLLKDLRRHFPEIPSDVSLPEVFESLREGMWAPVGQTVFVVLDQAYGRLPEELGELTGDQEAFLDQAVEGLVQGGKVICVRLDLFADMVKGKPWSAVTLKEVGGLEGLGVTFLEETFSAPTAPAQHRHHQKAAQAVLKALLPEAGSWHVARGSGESREGEGVASESEAGNRRSPFR